MSKHMVAGGDVAGMLSCFAELKRKAQARTGRCLPIIVIQEAGLDGFWIHRVLQAEGIESHVVDPASIATSRRRRRAKTDKLDGEALLRALLAYKRGEPRVCAMLRAPTPEEEDRRRIVRERKPLTNERIRHVNRVKGLLFGQSVSGSRVCAMLRAPTPEEEDRRRIVRERKALTNERIRHVNRVKGLLFGQGVSGYEPLRSDRRKRLEELKTGDGRLLSPNLKAQISRELDRIELLLTHIKDVEEARDTMLESAQAVAPAPKLLLNLKGIGPEFAAVLWSEGLSRHFDNRRQVAAYAGLAPTPWQSGIVDHEQGVSKSGNPRLRSMLIELSWLWVRHQPQSALTIWFKERVKQNGGRFKKSTIVALARKLLIAIWKYVNAGVVIEGAALKAA